jgi:hypothetical protein
MISSPAIQPPSEARLAMSLYQLHRFVWDHVRAKAANSSERAPVDAANYDLTDEELHAFETRDIAALYTMGLHPVLLNGYCRAEGFARDDYRKILEPLGEAEQRKGRWAA